MKESKVNYQFHNYSLKDILGSVSHEKLVEALSNMLLIRHFEIRAESAYQQGKVGGFFHAYIGQEAIQTAACAVFGIQDNWWITTYRCHALALLMKEPPKELMAELYGKSTGNALGRGGSMHLYSKRLLGGFGIVGGHLPIAAGAAFSLKYFHQSGVAVCFLGDGAVAQGTFHETLNLISLWNLPCIVVIENNEWGMGTHVSRAICHQPMAESFAPAYNMSGYSFDGNDFFSCFSGFSRVKAEVEQTKRPVLVECVTQRFRGHSISDPGLYRSKEDLKRIIENDPIEMYKKKLIELAIVTESRVAEMEAQAKQIAIDAMNFAEESPFPDEATLENDVFAP